jgi:hypothetical protein
MVFDLVRRPDGDYVRPRFASMAVKQFRNEKLIDEAINLVTAQGVMLLTVLEELALWYEKMGLVVEDKWNLLSSPAENDPHPGSWPSGLSDSSRLARSFPPPSRGPAPVLCDTDNYSGNPAFRRPSTNRAAKAKKSGLLEGICSLNWAMVLALVQLSDR